MWHKFMGIKKMVLTILWRHQEKLPSTSEKSWRRHQRENLTKLTHCAPACHKDAFDVILTPLSVLCSKQWKKSLLKQRELRTLEPDRRSIQRNKQEHGNNTRKFYFVTRFCQCLVQMSHFQAPFFGWNFLKQRLTFLCFVLLFCSPWAQLVFHAKKTKSSDFQIWERLPTLCPCTKQWIGAQS